MNKIEIMSADLANKISAGEVIEKTVNVVKELVENSIDAKSTEITIDLIDSGIKSITVTDNGVGMTKEDALLAFSRHATSKITNLDDLFNIETLGFRGEALPSIAAVAKVVLTTSDGKEGTKVTINGGSTPKVENFSLQTGTKIIVNNLFYNTPVRLKYLKNPYIELANITDYLSKLALAHADIKFSLTNNDKLLLNTTGNGDILKVIYAIYGTDITKKMLEVSSENDDYYLSGYLSFPEVTKSNRNSITTIVNGRVIKNNDLNRTIIEAYHTYIPKDKYPIVVLNIDVDPILIDVNVHPTKMDIKFSKIATLEDLITKTIANKLENISLIPDISVRDQNNTQSIIPLEIAFKDDVLLPSEKNYEEVKLDFSVNEETHALEKDQPKIKEMIPRGVVYSTYIIAENEDGMYIIDQHAAAERINYENYLASMSAPTSEVTDLLIPIKIELPTNEYLIVKEHLDLLHEFGIGIEEFGPNTFLIRSHPIWLKEGLEEASLRKIVELVSVREAFSKEKFIERTAISLSCHMAIKANDYTSHEDQKYLLEHLRMCRNPFTCPHGRPTIITYTKYDLEKLFKRAMD
jgi:DNA mismatch repair protein MutL